MNTTNIISRPFHFRSTFTSSVSLPKATLIKDAFVPAFQTNSLGLISFAWDANSETDLSGYKLYYGTGSRSYAFQKEIGNLTEATLNGLTPGISYFVAVTAFDKSCLESDYSDELEIVIPFGDQNGTPSSEPVSLQNLTYSRSIDPQDCKEYFHTAFNFKGAPNTSYVVQRKVGNGAWEDVETFNVRPSDTEPLAKRSIFCNYRYPVYALPQLVLYRLRLLGP